MIELLNPIVGNLWRMNLRYIVLILFILLISVRFIIQRLRRHKKNSSVEDLSQYEKNEEGLYPWEVDTDDSPERIPKNAKRYVNQHQPRRGKW